MTDQTSNEFVAPLAASSRHGERVGLLCEVSLLSAEEASVPLHLPEAGAGERVRRITRLFN